MTILILIGVVVAAFGLMAVDWTPGRFNVGFARGSEISFKTHMESGKARFEDDALVLTAADGFRIPFDQITAVEVFSHTGVRRAFRIHWAHQAVILCVVRFLIAGQFAQGDYFGARRLEAELRRRLPKLMA